MLKKLVSALGLTSLAFCSGLCFSPYNHNYGVSTEQLVDGGNLDNHRKIIILQNGKMQFGTDRINLVRYVVNGNKALILIKGAGSAFGNEYFAIYTKCINGKPATKAVEAVSNFSPTAETVDLPNYPIKLGFYKDGFWTKALAINFIHHGDYSCNYKTEYFPYKLIKEHKDYNGPVKNQYLPPRVCDALAKNVGM